MLSRFGRLQTKFLKHRHHFREWPAIHNRLFTWLSAYRNATGLLYYETNRWFGGNEKAHANDPKKPIAFLNESSGTTHRTRCFAVQCSCVDLGLCCVQHTQASIPTRMATRMAKACTFTPELRGQCQQFATRTCGMGLKMWS